LEALSYLLAVIGVTVVALAASVDPIRAPDRIEANE
jgi:hypothetical protein